MTTLGFQNFDGEHLFKLSQLSIGGPFATVGGRPESLIQYWLACSPTCEDIRRDQQHSFAASKPSIFFLARYLELTEVASSAYRPLPF